MLYLTNYFLKLSFSKLSIVYFDSLMNSYVVVGIHCFTTLELSMTLLSTKNILHTYLFGYGPIGCTGCYCYGYWVGGCAGHTYDEIYTVYDT